MSNASARKDASALDHAQLTEALADARLLQSISTEMISEGDAAGLYAKIVTAAQTIMHSDYAAMQQLDDERGVLELLAFRGFDENSANEWRVVRRDACSACAAALRENRRVVIADIDKSADLPNDDILRAFHRLGINAVQNTPLVSRSGKQVGMLSTQWRQSQKPGERDLRMLDILARQAADLIDRHHTEEALRAADQRKNEFLATLAHELRNPLAPLRNAAEILRQASDDPHVVEAVAGVLERQVALMVRLVDDLLDASRIGRGKVELRRDWTELATIIHQSIEAVRPMCEAKRQRLVVTMPEQPVLLYVDAARLIQALNNLLSNACKFTKGDGNVYLRAETGDGEVRIHIGDDGVGIDAEHIPRIFDMFAQGDTSAARAYGGLGIGLTLVKTFVEMHGGRVAAHSEGHGKGSEFTITLPLAPPGS